jgi:hypothetical protein
VPAYDCSAKQPIAQTAITSKGDRPMTMPCGEFQWAGRLMKLLAIVTLAGTIAATYFFDALLIDVATVIVFFLGGSVAAGSLRAAKWSLAIMIYYLAFAALALVALNFWPESLRLGGRPLSDTAMPWAIASFVTLGVWSTVCVMLLVRGLRTGGTSSQRRHALEPLSR